MGERWYDRFLGNKSERKKGKPLTRGQRKAILNRDNYTSQMRHYSEERGWYNHDACPYDNKPCSSLQVHHIKPRRTGGGNNPENLITLFECQHVGRCKDNRIK